MFFTKVSSLGFSAMRVAWAAVTLAYFLASKPNWVRYYSDSGIFPLSLQEFVFRNSWRFSLFDVVTSDAGVTIVCYIFCISLFAMMVGLWPRLTTIVSVMLLFSFHERNLMILGGGDTVMRNLGFLLMISPGIYALSVHRLKPQWQQFKEHRTLLKAPTMSIWPYRLLLWQFLIIYITSGIDKLTGSMWWKNGTAMASALHHTHFARIHGGFMDTFSIVSPIMSRATIVFELLWSLLLIPIGFIKQWLPPFLQAFSLKRFLLLGGLVFHGGIFIFMEVGIFPWAMLLGYLGLLLDDDWKAIKRALFGSKPAHQLIYDGKCSFCIKNVFVLKLLDWGSRLQILNFQAPTHRKKMSQPIPLKQLRQALQLISNKGKIYSGFYAIRKLMWSLPALWILAPLLYIPGVPYVGNIIYQKIAEKRYCLNGQCTI
jgi:predicted DCC family thiol-disulfide oxidoreductase YuxK